MENEKYEVMASHGVLSESPKNWTKELRTISWFSKEPKFDIREWAPDDKKMSKGITLSLKELQKLKEILNGIEL